MFFHHFSDSRCRDLIAKLMSFVDGRLLINDLGRCWPNYVGAGLLCLAESAGVRHDAMLSVKRGFRPDDLRRIVDGIPGLIVQAYWRWPFRVCAMVEHERSGNGKEFSGQTNEEG